MRELERDDASIQKKAAPEPAPAERVQMKKAVQAVDGFDAQSAALAPSGADQKPVQMFGFSAAASVSTGLKGLGGGGGSAPEASEAKAPEGGGGASGGGGMFKLSAGLKIGPSIKGNGTDPQTVSALQTKLAGLGFYQGAVDGRISGNLIDGVKAFQKSAGLTPDGVVGPKTYAALQSAGSAKKGGEAHATENDADADPGTSRGTVNYA